MSKMKANRFVYVVERKFPKGHSALVGWHPLNVCQTSRAEALKRIDKLRTYASTAKFRLRKYIAEK